MKGLARLAVATVAASLLTAAPGWSASCSRAAGDLYASGDLGTMRNWGCGQQFIDFFWNAYDFDKGNWDEGFGYDQPCDLTRPLARTFNALYSLHYSAVDYATSAGDRRGSVLRWGGQFARSNIDELDGACNDGTKIAHTLWGAAPDHYTNLYMRFFFDYSVPERAALVLHEARHASGIAHCGEFFAGCAAIACPARGSCDHDWAYNGANRYEAAWLWEYAFNSVRTSDPLRIRAQDRANTVLRQFFNIDPGFVVNNTLLDNGDAVAVTSWDRDSLDVYVRRPSDGKLFNAYYEDGWAVNSTGNLGWWEVGSGTSAPAAASWADERTDLFVRGAGGDLQHRWFENGWSGWESLGGSLASAPTVASWGPGRLDVFALGTDDAVWHRAFQNGVGWTPWESLGGLFRSAPAAVSWGPNRIDIFARGDDNALWHLSWNNGWSGWESLGGVLTSAPTVASWGPGRLDVFARGTDRGLWHTAFQGQWFGWESLGDNLASGPGAVSWSINRIDIFYKNDAGQLRQRTWANAWKSVVTHAGP